MSDMTSRGFTRRNFIKGAALLGATGALVGCSPQQKGMEEATSEVAKDEIYAGVCRGNCAGGCFLNVHVRDGQVVRTTARDMPNTDYNRICTKGLTHVARIYGADRLQYPMKRVGERGEGKFERISWDEAFDTIAENWKGIADQYGPGAMSVFYASGNYAICSGVGLGGATDRFINVTGASYIHQSVDAAHGRAFGVITGMGPYGTNNEPADYKNSKTFICWGANPSVSQPQVMHFIMEAKENGTKFVVIDPVYNATAAKADWYIPIKAGTDGALGFGLLHEIIEQGLVDEEFVRAHTEACLLVKSDDGKLLRMSDLGVEPEMVLDSATGKEVPNDPYVVWDEDSQGAVALDEASRPAITGVSEVEGFAVKTTYDNLKEIVAEYPLEKVESITGIPQADIKELARLYTEEGPVNTYSMFGCDHYVNGHYNYWSMYLTSIFTGNVGKPGAAVGFSEAMPVAVANMAATLMPTDASGNLCQGQAAKYFVNQVGEIQETGKIAGQDAVLKGVYITLANPLVNMAEHEYTQSWISNMDFVVVADMTMTETAKYADILLPSAHWFEQTDLFTSYSSHPYLLWQDKAIEPLFEAKSDFQIYKTLCEKLGYGEFWDITEEDFIAQYVGGDAAKAMGVTFDALKNDKAARLLPGDPYVSFEGGTFATATGRARLYQDVVTPDYNSGQTIDESKEVEPYWEPAREADEASEARKAHPFHLISEHHRSRTHSQWGDVAYLKEIYPEPVVKINPDDAAELGVIEGDIVKLSNDRGYVVMKAALHAGNPRGVISATRGWSAWEFVDGHFASLPSKEFNQVCANQAFNDVAVSIEKA